jgi:hypothetical protein
LKKSLFFIFLVIFFGSCSFLFKGKKEKKTLKKPVTKTLKETSQKENKSFTVTNLKERVKEYPNSVFDKRLTKIAKQDENKDEEMKFFVSSEDITKIIPFYEKVFNTKVKEKSPSLLKKKALTYAIKELLPLENLALATKEKFNLKINTDEFSGKKVKLFLFTTREGDIRVQIFDKFFDPDTGKLIDKVLIIIQKEE